MFDGGHSALLGFGQDASLVEPCGSVVREPEALTRPRAVLKDC